ncbi:MAG: CoA transferase, partial [Pseudomonadota bacterium]|nr:CoA transferase [Pseudomonadota bacterium]
MAALRLLDGVRVVEWAEGVSAPFGARILADLGADVMKLERPITGDPMRARGPFLPDGVFPDNSA